jgi:branched-chain amino acid transport system ATP-binding protein
MSRAALTLVGIEQRFGTTEILRGIDLSIEVGERHALIGPNGAGKSTLFDVIAGTRPPYRGRVVFDGTDITGRPSHAIARRGLARSFQTTTVFERMSVLENLRCAVRCGSLRGLGWRRYFVGSREVDRRAWEVLDALALGGHAHAPAAALSYGDARSLDLGIALASGATTLLVDEPTAGLNREEARRAIALLRTVSAGKTLVMIEHDMEAVFGLADRISVLVQGRIVASGTPDEIRADDRVRAAYLGDRPLS